MENKKITLQIGQLIHLIQLSETTPHHIPKVGQISASELHIIEAIGHFDGITTKYLSEQLGITKGAVSQLTKKMETNEFIIKTTSRTDKRSSVLSLSPKGVEAYNYHQAIISSFSNKIEQELTHEETQGFSRGLNSLIQTLQENLKERE